MDSSVRNFFVKHFNRNILGLTLYVPYPIFHLADNVKTEARGFARPSVNHHEHLALLGCSLKSSPIGGNSLEFCPDFDRGGDQAGMGPGSGIASGQWI
jgi:hypothetical protein